jgi:hypothetical protein
MTIKQKSLTRHKEPIEGGLEQRLLVYAFAVGATLVGATPSNAEVLFTPSHAVFRGYSGRFGIDLDHDGSEDFVLFIRPVPCCSGYGSAPGLGITGVASNKIAAIGPYRFAEPLNRTARIDKGHPFQAWAIMSSAFGYLQWHDAEDKFLGVRFLFNGEVHYGWIGFRNITAEYPVITAKLGGWAYETIPGKAILAGDTGSSESGATFQPTSLEILSAGHTAIEQRLKRKFLQGESNDH